MNRPSELKLILIIPTYNEGQRLDCHKFVKFLRIHPGYHCLFVNDGSTDQTQNILEKIEKELPSQVTNLCLDKNYGKAEAVRKGILEAIKMEPEYFGYWDADLDIPLAEVASFMSIAVKRKKADVFIGSRIPMLGRQIERRPMRQFLAGFASALISMVLKLKIHDSQCGAKIFRKTPKTQELFEVPFLSKWLFDVEIIARYKSGAPIPLGTSSPIIEVPLTVSHFSSKSHVSTLSYISSAMDLLRILYHHRGARPSKDLELPEQKPISQKSV